MAHLNWHLTQSEPGSALHHMSVLRAPSSALSPFGLIDETKIKMEMWCIVPDGPRPEELIAGAMAQATVKALRNGEPIVLAVFSQQMWGVEPPDDLSRRLVAEGKPLAEHPRVMEVTVLYAAAVDGRRWRGRRYLTGPRAGETQDATLLVGTPVRGESHGIAPERLMRAMVGMCS